MSQIHVVIRRVSPALKIDLVQVGRLNDRQFESLPFSVVSDLPIAEFLRSSHISDSLYIDHSEITNLIASCGDLPCFSIEFFDNTIVLVFEFNLSDDEGTTKEEGKGN